MSAGIVRIKKFSGTSPKGIQIHDQREFGYSHSNPDIKFEKSHLNYDLHNAERINYTGRIRQRIKELDLPKAVRKDAIVMVQCLVTSDKGFFDRLAEGEQEKFFIKSFEWVKKRYGKENIISATVHLDEKTPHMHVNFVPVTSDGRLCAKDLFKKKDMTQLHDDFYRDIGKGFGLDRGEPKEEKQKHLSVEEFKEKTLREAKLEAAKIISGAESQAADIIGNAEESVKKLKTDKDGLMLDISSLEAQKTELNNVIPVLKDSRLRLESDILTLRTETLPTMKKMLEKVEDEYAKEKKEIETKLKNALKEVDVQLEKAGEIESNNIKLEKDYKSRKNRYNNALSSFSDIDNIGKKGLGGNYSVTKDDLDALKDGAKENILNNVHVKDLESGIEKLREENKKLLKDIDPVKQSNLELRQKLYDAERENKSYEKFMSDKPEIKKSFESQRGLHQSRNYSEIS